MRFAAEVAAVLAEKAIFDLRGRCSGSRATTCPTRTGRSRMPTCLRSRESPTRCTRARRLVAVTVQRFLERRTLHGHFSCDLEPVLTIDSGDSIVFSAPDAGWGVGPPTDPDGNRERFGPRDDDLDAGHPLVGPVEIRGARSGKTLEVRIDEVRVGTWGITDAGGWHTPLNERLGVAEGDTTTLVWELTRTLGSVATRRVGLSPFVRFSA